MGSVVSDASGVHMVETYSSMGLVMDLYVARNVSFRFPHVVDVSALSICIVLRAFVVISMCLVSRVSPSIYGECDVSLFVVHVMCCSLLGLV